MFESIIESLSLTSLVAPDMVSLLVALGTALGLGLLLALIYRKTHRGKTSSGGFTLTLAILPPTIAAIIMLVGTNIASAFSLAGAFSIIRFRSAPGDPKEIGYVLFCMAVGLASGMGFPVHALVIAILLGGAMLALESSGIGSTKEQERLLKITIPENLDHEDAFLDIFQRYTVSHTLNRLKTSELGSLYVLEYAVLLKNGIKEKQLMDELRTRNGNLTISMLRGTGGYES